MKKYSLLFGMVIIFSFLLTSCSKEKENDSIVYNISLTATEGGVAFFENFSGMSIDAPTGSYVTAVAFPDETYMFYGWYLAGSNIPVSTSLSYDLLVEENMVLIAKFKKLDNAPAEMVDLGLSVKWASCNVGATSPEETGTYYAWGETVEKDDYAWSSYSWWDNRMDYLTMYCTDNLYGIVDNRTSLESADDVASTLWGCGWRMPTHAEQDELLNDCFWEWTMLNGVYGYKVTGPNGKSIFLPAVGYRIGDKYYNIGLSGYYWSNSLDTDCNNNALYIVFSGDTYGWGRFYERYVGLCVRPVCE